MSREQTTAAELAQEICTAKIEQSALTAIMPKQYHGISNKENRPTAPELTTEEVKKSVFGLTAEQAEVYKSLFAASLIDPNKQEPEPETLLSYKDTPVLWRGCKGIVCGVAKARKTTALTILSAILMGKDETAHGFRANSNLRVLYCDTEQARTDSQRILHRVARLTNKTASALPLDVLSLSQLDSEQIKGVIEIALQVKGYDIVVLDNWTDCVVSVMEDRDCTAFSRQLRELAETYNVAILSVIHANESAKKDDRPDLRGWAKEETRKSDITLYLKDKGDYSQATFGKCRGKRPEGFCVSHDTAGLPCIYTPTPEETANPDKYADIVAKIPPTGMRYKELCTLIATTAKVSDPTAKRWVKSMTGGAVKEVNGLYYPIATAPKTEDEILPF